jgi:hypothetical protein
MSYNTKLCNKFNIFVKRTGELALTLTFARQCPIIDFICSRYTERTPYGTYDRRL